MYEDVEMSSGANFDFVGDEAHTFALQFFERVGDIVDVDGYMMQPLAALRDRLAEHGMVRRGFGQFEAAFPYREHGSTPLPVLSRLFADSLPAELLGTL